MCRVVLATLAAPNAILVRETLAKRARRNANKLPVTLVKRSAIKPRARRPVRVKRNAIKLPARLVKRNATKLRATLVILADERRATLAAPASAPTHVINLVFDSL